MAHEFIVKNGLIVNGPADIAEGITASYAKTTSSWATNAIVSQTGLYSSQSQWSVSSISSSWASSSLYFGGLTSTSYLKTSSFSTWASSSTSQFSGTSSYSATSSYIGIAPDADKLDGQHGAYYLDITNQTGVLPLGRLTGSYNITSSWAGNAIVSQTGLYSSQSQWSVSSSFSSQSIHSHTTISSSFASSSLTASYLNNPVIFEANEDSAYDVTVRNVNNGLNAQARTYFTIPSVSGSIGVSAGTGIDQGTPNLIIDSTTGIVTTINDSPVTEVTSTALKPYSNNSITLGDATQKWLAVYATDFIGTASCADTLDDQHGAYYLDITNQTGVLPLGRLTGSYNITSSWSVSSSYITASNVYGAINSCQTASYLPVGTYGITSSWSNTASYVTASNVYGSIDTAKTASYVTASNVYGTVDSAKTASYFPAGTYGITSSWSTTASYVTASNVYGTVISAKTASYLPTGTYSITSSWSNTASYVTASNVYGTVTSAKTASYLPSGIYPITSSYALTASKLTNPVVFTDAVGTNFDVTVENTIAPSSATARLILRMPTITGSIGACASTYTDQDIPNLIINSTTGIVSAVDDVPIAEVVSTGVNPYTNLGADLGTSGKKWNNIYANTLHGTSSYATNALSASYSTSSSYAITSSYALTASYISAAYYAYDSDKLDGLHGSYYLDITNHTGIIATSMLTGSYPITSSWSNTASYVTASNVYGTVGSSQTASYLPVGTYPVTASWSNTSSFVTASNVYGTVTSAKTASYVTASGIDGTVNSAKTASYLPIGTYPVTASWSNTASFVTASNVYGTVTYAKTASYVTASNVYGTVVSSQTASYLPPGTYSITSSISNNATSFGGLSTSSYTSTSSLNAWVSSSNSLFYGTASKAISSSYAESASFATTCSYSHYYYYDVTVYHESTSFASSSASSSYSRYAVNTLSASWASSSISASYITASGVVGAVRLAETASYLPIGTYQITASQTIEALTASYLKPPVVFSGNTDGTYSVRIENQNSGLNSQATTIYAIPSVTGSIGASDGTYVDQGAPNLIIGSSTGVVVGIGTTAVIEVNSSELIPYNNYGASLGSATNKWNGLYVNTVYGTSSIALSSSHSDFLDGQHSAYYLDITNQTGVLPLGRLTGSYNITSSWSNTASYVTASNVNGTVTSAKTASYLPVGTYSMTSSWSTTSSWSNTASYVTASNVYGTVTSAKTASYLPVGTYPVTSSWSNNSLISQTGLYSSQSQWAVSASWASASLSASFVTASNIVGTVNSAKTASYLPIGTYPMTASWSNNSLVSQTGLYSSQSQWSVSSSYASQSFNTDRLNGYDSGSFLTTSSFSNWQTDPESSFAGQAASANYAGLAGTADTASYVTASNVNGTVDSAKTASYLPVGTYSITSSWANTASFVTASYVYGTVNSAKTASYLPIGTYSITSSRANTASFVTASNVYGTVNSAKTASYLPLGTYPITSSWSTTSSYVTASNVDGTVTSAKTASYLTSPTYAGTSSYTATASYLTNPVVFETNADSWYDVTIRNINTGFSTRARTHFSLPRVEGSIGVSDSTGVDQQVPNVLIDSTTGIVSTINDVPVTEIVSTGLNPYSDLGADLGTSAKQWVNVYASNFIGTSSYADILDSQHGSYYLDITNQTGVLPLGRLTGSYNITASWANTASYITASNVYGTVTSAKTASYFPIGTYSLTSSWSNNSLVSQTGMYASHSNWTVSSSFSSQSIFSVSASWASSSFTSSYVTASNVYGTVTSAKTASYLTAGTYGVTSSWSVTASYVTASNVYGTVTSAKTASYLTAGTYSITSSWANTASFVTASNVYGTVNNAVSSSYASTASILVSPVVFLDNVNNSLAITAENRNSGTNANAKFIFQLPTVSGSIGASESTFVDADTPNVIINSTTGIISSINDIAITEIVSTGLNPYSNLGADLGTTAKNWNNVYAISFIGTSSYADILDNQHGSYYLDVVNHTGVIPVARLTGSYTITSSRSNTASYVTASDVDGTVVSANTASYLTIGTYLVTSSWSITSSYVTASNVYGTVTSAKTASYLPVGTYRITSSWSSTASFVTASNVYGIVTFAKTASYLPAGTYPITSSYALTASKLTNPVVFTTASGTNFDVTIENTIAPSSATARLLLQLSTVTGSVGVCQSTFADQDTPNLIINSTTGIVSAVNDSPITVVASTGLNPYYHAASDLGTSTQRWNTVYANTFEGTSSYADKLDDQHGEYYLDVTNHTGVIPVANLTGSYRITSSWSNTASFVTGSNVRGTVGTANTASYVRAWDIYGTVDAATFATNALSASWASSSISSSYARTASYAVTASYVSGAYLNAFIQGGNSFGSTAILGTNDNYDLMLETSNTQRVSVPKEGGFVVGTSAIATNATDGFLYIPTCNGIPTGVPTVRTGTAPIVYDSNAQVLYIYMGGWIPVNARADIG